MVEVDLPSLALRTFVQATPRERPRQIPQLACSRATCSPSRSCPHKVHTRWPDSPHIDTRPDTYSILLVFSVHPNPSRYRHRSIPLQQLSPPNCSSPLPLGGIARSSLLC